MLTIERMKIQMRPQKDRIPINFLLSKEVDQRFRLYLAKKYNGYHKGVLALELEKAVSQFVDEEEKKL
jgi:hypothetical protein